MIPNNTRNPQAETLFRKRYGSSPNVMTPRIYARRLMAAGNLAVELSNGDGFKHPEQIWGVTVLNVKDVRSNLDLNQSFSTRDEAEAYIETLRAWRPVDA